MAFYLTYRPQKISELDSKEVGDKLSSILSTPTPPHALLFTGPKGLGKTSSARIVAKIVNCEHRTKGLLEPCNKCVQCLSITNGTNLDVLEIDAASNRGIDEIRDLKEKIKLTPSGGKWKIYIIDEVHMLTTEAFNALLKTLEEPPPNVMFILCTTDPHKVPQTIQSRCFHIPFSRATNEELVHSLKRIITKEKISIDEDSLLEIAKGADGSFRDASKLLEQAKAAMGRGKITKKTITVLLGTSYNAAEFIILFSERKVKETLFWITQAADEGLSIRPFIEDVLAILHSCLLQKYGISKVQVNSTLLNISEEDIKKMIRLLMRAHEEVRFAVIPQLPVELAVIEYCMENKVD